MGKRPFKKSERASFDKKGDGKSRGKGKSSRFGGGDEKPSRSGSYKRSGGSFPSRSGGFRKRSDEESGSYKKSDRSSDRRSGRGFDKSERGGRDEARSFRKPGRSFGEKKEGGFGRSSGGFKKSFRKEDDGERTFRKPGRSFGEKKEGGFGRSSGGFKKSFGKEGEGERTFRKPGRSFGEKKEGGFGRSSGGFKKSFRKEDEGERTFRKPGRSFGEKKEGGFGRSSGGFKKSFRKSGDDASDAGSFREKKTFGKKRFDSGEESSFSKRKIEKFDPKRDVKKSSAGEKKSFVESRIEKQRKRPAAEETSFQKKEGDADLIRLNKFMANSGVGSRRQADEFISMGLVSVNGETITEMGYKVKPTDDVRFEGKKLKAEKPVYILLNKPKGFITTTDDPQERNTVMNLVANAGKERIYPVGRLDRNTTGLLLLTNDGDLADKLTHPSYNVKKIYKVELDKALTKNDLQKISEGVYLEEGRAQVDDIAIVSDDYKTVGIELHIGWNRIVRRIFESLGYEVVKLDRVVYAGLDKKDLGRGEWRHLKQEEIVRLKHYK